MGPQDTVLCPSFHANSDGTWTETALHHFRDSDGVYPYGPVTLDNSGALYGSIAAGGPGNSGVVFKLSLQHT